MQLRKSVRLAAMPRPRRRQLRAAHRLCTLQRAAPPPRERRRAGPRAYSWAPRLAARGPSAARVAGRSPPPPLRRDASSRRTRAVGLPPQAQPRVCRERGRRRGAAANAPPGRELLCPPLPPLSTTTARALAPPPDSPRARVEGRRQVVQERLRAVSAEIAALSAEIAALDEQLQQVEARTVAKETARDAAAASGHEARAAYLTRELWALMEEERQLRDKKIQLGKKDLQLFEEQLLLLRPLRPAASAGSQGAGVAPRAALFRAPVAKLLSPSRPDASEEIRALYALTAGPPVSVSSAVDAAVVRRLLDCCGTEERPETGMLSEGNFYALATSAVPTWLRDDPRSAGTTRTAEALFGPLESVIFPQYELPWQCQPELLTAPVAGAPPFNGELTSVRPPTTYDKLATYLLFGLLKAFFPAPAAGAPPARRFYARPPVGYGIVAFPHCGYLVAAEWVGKLLLTPVSEPFFLGSPAHAAAVAALERPDPAEFATYVDLEGPADDERPLWATHSVNGAATEPGGRVVVVWCTEPLGGKFYKVIESTAFDTLGKQPPWLWFRDLHETYGAYAAAIRDARGRQPATLLPARLLYGAAAVLVEMPFVRGRHATLEELVDSGPVQDAVLAAVAWLARRALLYIDLRPLNVLVDDATGACWLVDYDDVSVLQEPPTSGAELSALLHERCTAGARELVLPGINGRLRELFDTEPAGG